MEIFVNFVPLRTSARSKMTGSQVPFANLLVMVISLLIGGSTTAQIIGSPRVPISSSAGPPILPKYYATTSQKPPSPHPQQTSSLSPTSPIYSAQKIRSSYSDNTDYDDPYPSGPQSYLGNDRPAANPSGDDQPNNAGFVEPIDFSGLLKDIGNSPSVAPLNSGSDNNANPLFASESKDTFQGFFGSRNNPFEELGRLHTASSDHSSNPQGSNDEDNVGFVDPNVQFRSLFDSAGSSAGFGPADFLGSKGSQTRAYPSYTYTGRGSEGDREDSDYRRNPNPPNRYRSSYRQVGHGDGDGGGSGGSTSNNPYYAPNNIDRSSTQYPPSEGRQYDDYDDGLSNNSHLDSYDDDDSQQRNNGYNNSPGRRGVNQDSRTSRYSPAAQETADSPQSKSPKKSRCKKVEKSATDYGEDHASFTDPGPDYDPSTYQGRYRRQARQRSRSNNNSPPRRPMTCYVCEDEHGRYAEKCSYDSKDSPSNNNGNYYHSESSSFSDNGRRPSSGRSKDRHRRNLKAHAQRQSGGKKEVVDAPVSESSTTLRIEPVKRVSASVSDDEMKVLRKRQSDDYRDFRGGQGGHGGGYSNNDGDGFGDPYDARTGTYSHPTGYEGPELGPRPGGSDSDYHGGGGRGGHYHGGSEDSPRELGRVPDYEREASAATREYDFSIPREFDPDVQLRPQGQGGNSGPRAAASNSNPRGAAGPDFPFYSTPEAFASSQSPEQSASNRQDNQDEFDIGYNDYIRKNFPEALDSPRFSHPNSQPPEYSNSNYEFKPNYYHRPGSRDNSGNRERDAPPRYSPEISSNPQNDYRRGNNGGNDYRRGNSDRDGGGRGGFYPVREQTQPSHNFAPPPGFFSEDGPQAYPEISSAVKEFSSRSRDGCQKVHKGDMTCYVCGDARGAKKEECIYASNDPKNKAMAYHEVTEYSSPTANVLPAPFTVTLQGNTGNDVAASPSKDVLITSPSATSFSKVSTNIRHSSTSFNLSSPRRGSPAPKSDATTTTSTSTTPKATKSS